VLAVDLIVAGRAGRATVPSAALWSGAWIGLGLCVWRVVAARFDGPCRSRLSHRITLEKSLSVDNPFVFAL